MTNAPRGGPAFVGLMAVLLTLTGCGGEDPVDRTSTAPAPTVTSTPAAIVAPTPTPTADTVNISRDKVVRGVPPPSAVAKTSGDFVVNVTPKLFVDPPLPPELNDDGGLKPLPKPGQ